MSAGGDGWESIPAMTAAAAERFGAQPAVVDGDTQLSYAELFDRSRAFGSALVATGMAPGDRVAIWAFNCAEWIVAGAGRLRGRRGAGADQHPFQGRARRATSCAAAGPGYWSRSRDFLGTDYVAMLGDAGRRPG